LRPIAAVPAPPRVGQALAASQATLESLVAVEHQQCLLCGPAAALGFKLSFRVQADGSVLARFPCREVLQGYPQMLHGGVISALLDAAMANALFSVGIVGVTADLSVRFLAPVALDRGAVVRAFVEKSRHRLFYVRSGLEQDGKLMARACGKFLVMPSEPDDNDRDHREANDEGGPE
jgi:uncharacterized protein (TIGR00369 family)